MKYKSIFIFLSSLSIAMVMHGQEIKIKDRIPKVELRNLVNYDDSLIELSSYCKGKVTLINFWHQYCGVGHDFILKLDSLKKTYPELQILIIGRESADSIRKFMRSQRFRNFSLPIAAEYKQMKVFFPHITPRHVIWVLRDGKVKAITSHEELRNNPIKNFIKGLD